MCVNLVDLFVFIISWLRLQTIILLQTDDKVHLFYSGVGSWPHLQHPAERICQNYRKDIDLVTFTLCRPINTFSFSRQDVVENRWSQRRICLETPTAFSLGKVFTEGEMAKDALHDIPFLHILFKPLDFGTHNFLSHIIYNVWCQFRALLFRVALFPSSVFCITVIVIM